MQKIDKMYLDIDGVIRGAASPKEDVMKLLRYCLNNCPFRMNPRDSEMAKKALDFLKRFSDD